METVSYERFRKGLVVMFAVGVGCGIGLQRLVLTPIARSLKSMRDADRIERVKRDRSYDGVDYKQYSTNSLRFEATN